MKVKKEYERIKEIFSKADETLLSLNDGAIWETARIKVELDELHEIIKVSGRIKTNPKNPAMQRNYQYQKLLKR